MCYLHQVPSKTYQVLLRTKQALSRTSRIRNNRLRSTLLKDFAVLVVVQLNDGQYYQRYQDYNLIRQTRFVCIRLISDAQIKKYKAKQVQS